LLLLLLLLLLINNISKDILCKLAAKMNENDQIYGSKGGIVNKVSIPSRKTSDAKPQQKSMKMMKSLVIQGGLVMQNNSKNQ